MDESQGLPQVPQTSGSDLGRYIGLVFAVLLIAAGTAVFLHFRGRILQPRMTDEQRAIATVKLRYEPGSRLLRMNPDPHPTWTAEKFNYCVDKAANCWLVHSALDVISMVETQSMAAQWIVDLKTSKVWPRNAEARLMFAPMPDTSSRVAEVEKVSHWTARTESAEAVTGDIESTPTSMTIGGTKMRVSLVRKLAYDELIDTATLFSRDITPDTIGGLYRMGAPDAPMPQANPMCNGRDTSWVVAVITRVNGPDYGQELQLAAFSGSPEPVLTLEAIKKSPELCGTYGYQKSSGAPGFKK